jgi:hypothetical protein
VTGPLLWALTDLCCGPLKPAHVLDGHANEAFRTAVLSDAARPHCHRSRIAEAESEGLFPSESIPQRLGATRHDPGARLAAQLYTVWSSSTAMLQQLRSSSNARFGAFGGDTARSHRGNAA